jgi:hypothetical protein
MSTLNILETLTKLALPLGVAVTALNSALYDGI